jgi:hypothetical protein
MQKIVFTVLLSCLLANTALAAPASSVGLNYSFDDVFGTQFEFDISKAANNRPVSVQLFWKSYSQHLGTNNTWDTSSVGAVGIYDFTSVAKLDKKLHPYAGLGLMSVSYVWAGNGAAKNYSGVGGGFYVTGGARYDISPQIAADVNYNNFGGITMGVNFNF